MYKMTIETFRPPFHEIRSLERPDPYVFNDVVGVKKYRITIEEIEEPVEVIHKRLQLLWDRTNNPHYKALLRNAAESYGYELRDS